MFSLVSVNSNDIHIVLERRDGWNWIHFICWSEIFRLLKIKGKYRFLLLLLLNFISKSIKFNSKLCLNLIQIVFSFFLRVGMWFVWTERNKEKNVLIFNIILKFATVMNCDANNIFIHINWLSNVHTERFIAIDNNGVWLPYIPNVFGVDVCRFGFLCRRLLWRSMEAIYSFRWFPFRHYEWQNDWHLRGILFQYSGP